MPRLDRTVGMRNKVETRLKKCKKEGKTAIFLLVDSENFSSTSSVEKMAKELFNATKNMKKLLDVEFGVSKGAYYRQLGQARSKIESLYYTILLLQAYDVILPESDVMFRLAEQLNVMKESDFAPENEGQIMDVIQKAVKQLVNM